MNDIKVTCKKSCLHCLNILLLLPFGAGDGSRTHNIQLGRLTLYQLSYTRESFFVGFLQISDLAKARYDHVEDSPLQISAY